jgi:hypothetical protein
MENMRLHSHNVTAGDSAAIIDRNVGNNHVEDRRVAIALRNNAFLTYTTPAPLYSRSCVVFLLSG